MKQLKILIMGAMLAIAAFSVTAVCYIEKFDLCPKSMWLNSNEKRTYCTTEVDNYEWARLAYIGETNGLNTIKYGDPICRYSCGDGTYPAFYPNVILSGSTNCQGITPPPLPPLTPM